LHSCYIQTKTIRSAQYTAYYIADMETVFNQ